jgi:hypothetical protein
VPRPRRIAWIHLEYLSAQAYAGRSHGLASPVLGGAAAGVHRWFFFPGFTPDTGGLLREAELANGAASSLTAVPGSPAGASAGPASRS